MISHREGRAIVARNAAERRAYHHLQDVLNTPAEERARAAWRQLRPPTRVCHRALPKYRGCGRKLGHAGPCSLLEPGTRASPFAQELAQAIAEEYRTLIGHAYQVRAPILISAAQNAAHARQFLPALRREMVQFGYSQAAVRRVTSRPGWTLTVANAVRTAVRRLEAKRRAGVPLRTITLDGDGFEVRS